MVANLALVVIAMFAWVTPLMADDLLPKSERVPSVVAEMGGVKLSEVEFEALKSHLTPENLEKLEKDSKARSGVVQDAIIKKFLITQANGTGFDKKSAVREQMDRAAEQSLLAQYVASHTQPAADFPSETEIKNLYEKNKEVLRQPSKVHVAQIFLNAPRDADEAVKKKARTRIYQIFREVVTAPKKFGEVAKLKSEHKESASNGGDMGWVTGDQLIPELLPVVATLHPDEIGFPVQSGGGWHILKLVEVRKGEVLPFATVRTTLMNAMRRQETQKKEQEFFQQLIKTTPPTIFIK